MVLFANAYLDILGQGQRQCSPQGCGGTEQTEDYRRKPDPTALAKTQVIHYKVFAVGGPPNDLHAFMNVNNALFDLTLWLKCQSLVNDLRQKEICPK